MERKSTNMTCADYRQWMSIDMDGELGPRDGLLLAEHLEACASCRQVREDYQVNRLLMRTVEPRKAPADAFARIQERLATGPARVASTPAPVRQGATRTPWGRAAAVRSLRLAASLAVVCVGALAWLGATDPDVPAPVQVPRQVSVQPRTLMRGHAHLQAVNPMADRAAWRYLALEDEGLSPVADEEEDGASPFDSIRGM